MSRNLVLVCVLIGSLFLFLSVESYAYTICGDGKIEALEECDNGSANSDSAPNACRTDCVKAKCGDYGVDNGEECDDFPNNSDVIPNACRRNCKRAHCGDGVLDDGEQCDDKNNNDYDGCYQCMSCYPVKDNLHLSENMGENVKLCPGTYEFIDAGPEGIITIEGYGVNVDASGVTLVGLPPVSASAFKPGSMQNSQAIKQALSGPNKRITKRGTKTTKSTTTPSPSGQPPQLPRSVTGWQGTGIIVKGNDVVLHNVNVEGFKTGIKVQSNGAVLFNNRVCDNSMDIQGGQTGNYGVKNSCNSQQEWQENGQNGCTVGCN